MAHPPMLRVSLLFALVATSPAQDDAKTFKGKVVQLKERITSQLAAHQAKQHVGEAVVVAGTEFAARPTGKGLSVAREVGGEPSFKVRAGKALALRVADGENEKSVSVRFYEQSAGEWIAQAARAVRHKIGGMELRLVDLDLDDRFVVDRDGYLVDDHTVALPLRARLLVGDAAVDIVELSEDGTRLRARVSPLTGSDMQLAALRCINELRARHGLAPVELDEELTKGCTEHANYLEGNDWTGFTNPHSQEDGAAGATPSGASAAVRSVITKSSPLASIDKFWLTYYHRIGMMSPDLARIGINAEPPGISVIDVAQHRDGPGASDPWSRPTSVPADGARDVPTGSNAEKPYEPVPDLGSRGMPLIVLFRSAGAVTDFTGVLYEEKGRRDKTVPVLVADRARHAEACGIVPERRLDTKTSYRAEFTWQEHGKPRTKTVRFRTR